jgi:ribosomal protein L37AE/L43A
LTRAAGTINVHKRLITLSVPLLVDSYRTQSLFPPEYEVCGVKCSDSESALREILKHEMIHLWLFVLGRPYGHTMEFRQKARAIGQPRTRHGIALPEPKTGWIYTCSACGREYPRRRRYSRAVACGYCCKTRAGGNFDPRFKLRGRRVL